MDTSEIACCPGAIHAQIEYTSAGGVPVESLVSTDLKYSDNRKFLHEMLDEWMNRRTPGKGADHFIVYGRWPTEKA